ILDERGALRFFASKPAPTEKQICFRSAFFAFNTQAGREAAVLLLLIPNKSEAERRYCGAAARGAMPFGGLCRFCKVTRCKSETIRRRYPNNGYVPNH
ncbi:hypothetical protein, partial [Pseudomonas sp. I8001]|uniref:hypothetical protein n=1 Tax=Pseudomonas sp. I8001 TaxID=2738825 RepID=UPI001C42EC78